MLSKNTECDYPYCSNEIFKSQKYCILHCRQGIATQEDEWEFEKLFLKYLKDKIYDYLPKSISIHLDYYISVSDFFRNHDVIDFLKNNQITISDIYFPKFISLNSFNYLRLCKRIEFRGCYFNQKEIFVNGSNVKFYCCTFNCDIEKYFYNNFFKNYDNEIEIFGECIFKESILFNGIDFLENKISSLFYNCIFFNQISIEKSFINFDIFKFNNDLQYKNIFSEILVEPNYQSFKFADIGKNKKLINMEFFIQHNKQTKPKQIKSLKIQDCTFGKKINFNGLKIDNISIIDSIFKDKLEIKNSHFKKFEFKNSNVEKVADFFESHFNSFEMRKSIFRDFVGFENAIFGKETFGKATFTYVTFMSFVNFRGTTFNFGLDLSNTNLKEAPNFLGVKILSDNTNRETFRIIKNSFDKNGNHIEANNYFSKEMRAYKKENNKFLTQLILDLNNCISNFGNNYLKPIIILILSMLYYGYVLENQQNLYEYYANFNIFRKLEGLIEFLNNSAKNLLPFSSFLKDKQGIEFISLLFYIWFSILIWQIIVAIKRHTIR